LGYCQFFSVGGGRRSAFLALLLRQPTTQYFYHAKPQRHKEEGRFLSSSLCAFAALHDNI
jgi:hypothetical protein